MNYAGAVTKVYIDVMLATNFFIDLLILWAAGRLVGCISKKWRLFLGALLGAFYSLLVFVPAGNIIHSWPSKISFSLLMIAATYYPLKLRSFFLIVLNFYLISFAMGGAVIAATYILDDAPLLIQLIDMAGTFKGNIPYGMLVFALVVVVIIGWGGLAFLRKRRLQQDYFCTLKISLHNNQVETTALMDTGNQLREPLTNSLVVVVEAALLEDNLPNNLLQAARGGHLLTGLASVVEKEWLERLSLIPFNSVGKQNGIMLGIRPDWIEITNPNGTFRYQDIVLGLSERPLNSEGKYRALTPPMVLLEEF